tara:strand:- start:610 stop:777 length:168 start_codon:yes stop_codon:yes gene_type:complete
MELEQIISAFTLIAILILVLPGFIQTNIKKKVFFKNLSIWGVIVILLVILLIFVF